MPHERMLRPVNDIAYVRDNADGLKTALTANVLPNRAYNVSSGLRVTGRDIAAAVQWIDPAGAARLGVDPATHAAGETDEHLDLSRMKNGFGWDPQFSPIGAKLAGYVEWLRDYEF